MLHDVIPLMSAPQLLLHFRKQSEYQYPGLHLPEAHAPVWISHEVALDTGSQPLLQVNVHKLPKYPLGHSVHWPVFLIQETHVGQVCVQ